MKSRFALLALATACVTVEACSKTPVQPSDGTTAQPHDTGPPRPDLPIQGQLAFVSTRDGALAIYLADASGVRRLGPGDRPAWSPDGSQIAFNSAAGVAVMNADGTGVRHLGTGANPDWSPDGRRLVFNGPDGGIFVMNADGTARAELIDLRVVTTPSGYECGLYWPAWSPDGNQIAFVCASYDDVWQIHIATAGGSYLRRLSSSTTGFFTQSEPVWSSDGSQIAFDSSAGVDVINVDGSQLRTVVYDGFWADWSDDGRFAFTRITGPGPTLYDGSETRIFAATDRGAEFQLIPDVINPLMPRYGDSYPAWAP